MVLKPIAVYLGYLESESNEPTTFPSSPPPWSTADIGDLLGITRGGVVYLLRSRAINCRVSGGRYLIGPSELAQIRERKVGKPKREQIQSSERNANASD